MTSLETFLADIRALTPLPAVCSQLLAVVDDPDSSMGDIANIIQYDPIITANVLRACNSAFYGLKNPAESIRDAANMLGTDKVVELAIIKSGVQALSGTHEGYGLARGDMWRYSVSSAILAKQVAAKMGIKDKNFIFTSALLKDMGKIVLEKYVAGSRDRIRALVNEGGLSFREAEKSVLGIDHAELGAMIAKAWKFSPGMVNIIRNHHLPDETMLEDRYVAAVYLADCICMMMGIGVGEDGLSYRFRKQVMKEHGISADDFEQIIAEFAMSIDEVYALLNMA